MEMCYLSSHGTQRSQRNLLKFLEFRDAPVSPVILIPWNVSSHELVISKESGKSK